MRDDLAKANTAKAANVLHAYVSAAAARGPPSPRNVLVMFGDDVPLQDPWDNLYGPLDDVLASLNANSNTTGFTYK
jgi:hypothetical protein